MDWRECVNVDRHLQVMTTKASISHFFSNILFSFNTFVGMLYLISDNAIVILHQLNGINDTSRPFPIPIEFPFEYEQSPIYELLVAALFLHGMVNTYTISAVSVLIFTLVCLVKSCDKLNNDSKMWTSERQRNFICNLYMMRQTRFYINFDVV